MIDQKSEVFTTGSSTLPDLMKSLAALMGATAIFVGRKKGHSFAGKPYVSVIEDDLMEKKESTFSERNRLIS